MVHCVCYTTLENKATLTTSGEITISQERVNGCGRILDLTLKYVILVR